MMTMNMLQLSDNPAGLLNKLWMSSLVPPGCLLRHRDDPCGRSRKFVLESSEQGVLTWECSTETYRGITRLCFLPAEGTLPVTAVVPIVDYEQWQCQHVLVYAPSVLKMLSEDINMSITLGIVPDTEGSWRPLKAFSAELGFRGVTTTNLKQLYTHLKLPKPVPSTEYRVCFALVKGLLPHLTDPEVEHIVMNVRHAKRPAPVQTVVDEEQLQDAVEDFGDEAAVAEDELKEAMREARPKAKPQPKPKPKAKAKAQALAAGGRVSVDDPVFTDGLLADQVKHLFPTIAGSVLKRDPIAQRWQVHYPRLVPPFSASQAWSVSSDREALLYCWRWAWHEHRLADHPGPSHPEPTLDPP